MLSALEAAQRAGKSKATIIRAIRKGKISATRLDSGEYQIDPSELTRVYPHATGDARHESRHDTMRRASHDAGDTAKTDAEWVLKLALVEKDRDAAIQLAEERAEELKYRDRTIDDLRDRLDREGEERRKLSLLLTDQRSPEAKEARSGPRWWLVLGIGLLVGGAIAWAITQLPAASV